MTTNLSLPNDQTKALIFLGDEAGAKLVSTLLKKHGIESFAVNSLEQCLERMRISLPEILIVEDDTGSGIGIKAVRESLRISWTVSPILISDLNEEQIHDRAEGLGILGSMSSPSDAEKLDSLIDVFKKLRCR